MFDHLNLCIEAPEVGDMLILETKRNKGIKIAVVVKDIVYSDGAVELILQKGRNKYFNFDMYLSGESWVHKCWNLGSIKLTSGLINANLLDHC